MYLNFYIFYCISFIAHLHLIGCYYLRLDLEIFRLRFLFIEHFFLYNLVNLENYLIG